MHAFILALADRLHTCSTLLTRAAERDGRKARAIRELETDLAIEQAHARRLREEVEKRR